MSKNFIKGLLVSSVLVATTLQAGTPNTASLTDIKEAVSMVIKITEDQKKFNVAMLENLKKSESALKASEKEKEELLQLQTTKEGQNKLLEKRVESLSAKIVELENSISALKNAQYNSLNNRSAGDMSKDETMQADETITNFINSKKINTK